jgi:hypothetical protein
MSPSELVGRMLGLDGTQSIERVEPSLAAPWAQDAPAWLVFGCVAAIALAVVFYTRWQPGRRRGARLALAVLRAGVLALVLLILAQPVLTLQISSRLRPALWLVFDGTDSMAIADDVSDSEQARLAGAVGLELEGRDAARPARIDYLKALLRRDDGRLLARLEEKFRLRAYRFDRPGGVHGLELATGGKAEVDAGHLAEQLATDGEVTAVGAAFSELARRQAVSNLAGVVVFSDFNQNAGPPALESARRLGVPVYPVGVGPAAAVDLGVDLQVPPLLKKDERSSLVATVRQEGLDGRSVAVRFLVRPLSGEAGAAAGDVPVGERTVELAAPAETVEIPYVPQAVGQFAFVAEVDMLEDEVVGENNRVERESTVRDDFLRLLFVEYEPTWEWRFVKEVFHRDKLVGDRGFRTYLRSADPKVRQTNDWFLTSLAQPRSEFFAHDVIILGDMPASALSPTFCRMAAEFVGSFGGGLVVLAGPRFGPGQLARTDLGDLLPVKVGTDARLQKTRPFELQRTADAAQYDFMQLGGDPAENEKAWRNLGPLSWYQPVERLRPLATALAEHPTDACVDGQTRQPLIAAQPYGRGEVVYIGFNEMWRLRRSYGEAYYRQFWGQMIHRLALRHALGLGKRFVVRTDRRQYRADDNVLLTVEAYDADFKPLAEDQLPNHRLAGELLPPRQGSLDDSPARTLSITQVRDGVYEARLPVFAAGEHRIRVKDPVTDESAEVTFWVTAVSAERSRAVRNAALEEAIAETTGGKRYDLESAGRLPDEIETSAKTETRVEVVSLWNTWLAFGSVILLLLCEWAGRKWVNLP